MASLELDAYPRPGLAVDVAVLSVLPSVHQRGPTQLPDRLAVLVQHRPSAPRGLVLPGRFVRERQTLAEAVHDVLSIKAGIETVRAPRLLAVFDSPDRDERGWIVSVAHVVALPYDEVGEPHGSLVPVDRDGQLSTREHLLFDHEQVLADAVDHLRERYERRPDPDRLLGERFTLNELRRVHEAILGEPLLRDTFNRRMVDHLEQVSSRGESLTRSSGGRPARIYRRRVRRDLSPSEMRRTRLPRKD